MDVLTDVLNTLRLKSSVYYRSDIATISWSLHFKATACAMFHVIERGICFAQLDGLPPLTLQAGDMLVLPQGHAHTISYQPHLPPQVSIQLDQDYPTYFAQRYGEGTPTTTLICGVFDFEHQNRYPLLALMPKILYIPRERGQKAGLSATLRLIADESDMQRQGATTLLNRLSDVLFVQVARLWMDDTSHSDKGWLKALSDPYISQSLSLIHATPEYEWTVEQLAREVAMSRSAFAARFSELVGESPFQYLTRWRMQIALTLLTDNRLSLVDIATRVSYQSEAAFHRAFKRQFGINAGVYRRQLKMSARRSTAK